MEGYPLIGIAPPTSHELASFVLHTQPDDGCLIFSPINKATGYGSTMWRGKPYNAHRLALAWETGGFYRKLYALHSCGRKACVAVKHLRWGTQKENIEDALKAGAIKIGEHHHNAKYSNEQVLAVWNCWYQKKMRVSDIRAATGMTEEYVRQIVRREIRNDVTDALSGNVRREARELNKFGEGHHMSKLNVDAVRRIRSFYDAGLLSRGEQIGLAKEFGCSVQQIVRAARRQSWKQVH